MTIIPFFYVEKGSLHLRGGIKTKAAIMLFFFVMVTALISFSAAYVVGSNVFGDRTGKAYVQLSAALSALVERSFQEELKDVETYATSRLWIEALEDANKAYEGIDGRAILKQLKEKDDIWTKAQDGDDFIKKYLDSKISSSMRDILRLREGVAELFITDKFGGLIAASNRTSDFYQADELWWQDAYALGKGKVYTGHLEFDESSRSWSIPVAVPIRSPDGEIVGICKEVISIKKLLSQLDWFRIGRTGHAAVVDEDGEIIFHSGVWFPHQKYYEGINVKEMLSSNKHYRIVPGVHTHNTKMIIAFSPINLPALSGNGIHWLIFIDQEADEVFEALNITILRLSVIMGVILIMILPSGYYAAKIFAAPIHKLHMATEHILGGEWDYAIDVKTGDEIEQFADSFKELVSDVKKKQSDLMRVKLELEELNRKLEGKVKDRTRDLMHAQDAAMNIMEDLTETKNKLEEDARKLERAMQIKSDFTSTVSHELRTPLAAIKESISLVLDGITGEIAPQQREFLSMAKRNVDRLTWLINDILDFQKLESGKMKFDFRENNINGIVKEACETMSVLARQKGLELIADIEEEIPAVKLDRNKIFQVLSNLLSNAIKFTDKGRVTVATSRKDDIVKVSVIDTGGGIGKEDMLKLFKQFERLGEPGERRPGGTGLGLSISKGIIENHAGEIWVESEPGKGAAFNFTLPVNGPDAGVVGHL